MLLQANFEINGCNIKYILYWLGKVIEDATAHRSNVDLPLQ